MSSSGVVVSSREEVKVLCEKSREKLSSWLDQFGWTREGLEKKFGHLAIDDDNRKYEQQEQEPQEEYLACPFDSGHRRIARENYERHVNRCRLKHENYDRDDIKDYYKQPFVQSPYQVTIIRSKRSLGQIQVQNGGGVNGGGDISLTHKHSIINHRSDERLKFYEHALEEWKRLGLRLGADTSQAILDSDSGAGSTEKKNELDILNELRDRNKRRPKSYQTAKSRTYTESIRDLIQTQTDMLTRMNSTVGTPTVAANEAEAEPRSKKARTSGRDDDDHHRRRSSSRSKKKHHKSEKHKKRSRDRSSRHRHDD